MKTKLLAFALLTVALAQGQNLIKNNSFEQFTAGTPNSWISTSGTASQQTITFKNGTSSLEATPTAQFPGFMARFEISQDFTLSNTETYTLTFDYFIPGTSQSNSINYVTFDITRSNSAEAIFAPTNYPEMPVVYGVWKTVTFDFNIAAFKAGYSSATMNLSFAASSSFDNKKVYFDNVAIVKKSTLSTNDFTKQSNPVVSVSKEEIILDNNFKFSSYEIYSIDGKTVKSSKSISSNIDISGLNKGIYLLKFKEYSKTIKFIKE